MHNPAKLNGSEIKNARAWLFSLILVIATTALYLPVSQHPFLNFDDSLYVTDNPHVQEGLHWETVKWAFTSNYADNWHPLTWLSHALDCQLFGLDPAGPHQVNLILHAFNALLLFWVLFYATQSLNRSFLVAALFALHPINVESVAWIAERKNVLSMLFFLLALGAYRWYVARPNRGRYAVVALLFAFGLMAKPQIIVFPFILLLWDYWPLRRMLPTPDQLPAGVNSLPAKSLSWLVWEKVPLFVLSLASAVTTVRAQAEGGAISSYIPPLVRISTAIVSYTQYLYRAVWPLRLAVFYPYPANPARLGVVAGALLLLLAITFVAVRERRRKPYLVVGWLWFLGALLPMIGLVQVGNQATADRYAYLSFIGLFIMFCWGVADWTHEQRISPAWSTAGSVVILLGLAALAHRQISFWNDNVTLWARTVQVTRNNWVAQNNLGTALLDEKKPDAALEHFRAAVAIFPFDPMSNMNLAASEQKHGDLAKAVEHYQNVIKLTQNDVARTSLLRHDAFYRMSLAYRALGDSANASRTSQEAENLRRQFGP